MTGKHAQRRAGTKRLIALGMLIAVGVGAWQVGGRLSNDAIGMAVGMFFGVLAADGRRDDDDAYQAGNHDVSVLARTELPGHDKMCAEWAEAYMAQRNAVTVECPPRYTVARPFRLLPVAPALPYRCPVCLTIFGGDCCPMCGDTRQWRYDDADLWRSDGTPLAPDGDDCPDWCEPFIWNDLHPGRQARQYKVVGDVQPYIEEAQ